MKHLLTYRLMIEDVHTQPQINDYIVTFVDLEDAVHTYTNTHVGKVTSDIGNMFTAHYYNVPDKLEKFFQKERLFTLSEILFWSKDKQIAETFLQSKKYNI